MWWKLLIRLSTLSFVSVFLATLILDESERKKESSEREHDDMSKNDKAASTTDRAA